MWKGKAKKENSGNSSETDVGTEVVGDEKVADKS
jgi:hypothetical protein